MTSEPSPNVAKSKPVAVIDVGSTAIRMAIAEIGEDGRVRPLEKLAQAVSLGRDTFTTGHIRRGTTEECVRVLRAYRQILSEYGINDPDQIRVAATSAVREAENRFSFLERIYIATGLAIEALDEADESRVTYLGIQPLLSDPEWQTTRALVMEVGGGSTDILLVRSGNVTFSHSYRLGSQRLRKTLEAFRAPAAKSRQLMEGKIKRAVEQVSEHISVEGPIELIVLGGDVRFAAAELRPDWDPTRLQRLPLAELEELTDRMLSLSEDEIVQRYHLSFQAAETVASALLAYVMMAREFQLDAVLVSNVNLRDGLLQEMAFHEAWSEEFRKQIIRSAMNFGRRFDVDEKHAQHVAVLASSLFDQLKDDLSLNARHAIILQVAALLHEVGMFINTRSHHKHAMYLIRHGEIFGLGQRELLLTALVARYQRRASPQPRHEGFDSLNRDERVVVLKLSALLRLAIALADSRSQRVNDLHVHREDGQLVIHVPQVDDLALEQLALQQSSTLVEEVFGCRALLRTMK